MPFGGNVGSTKRTADVIGNALPGKNGLTVLVGAGVLTGLASAVAPIAIASFSDKTLKKNVRNAKDKDLMSPKEIDGFLNSLYAKQYNYKNPKHGKGKQVGIMAQDVEKTQLGKQMVEDTPEGKQINAAKGLGLVMASQARLNERLNAIGA